MTQVSCNCIICAEEFAPEELHSTVASKVNSTHFKVCQSCLDSSDPSEDYRQVREIVNNYLKFAEARQYYAEAQEILDSHKK